MVSMQNDIDFLHFVFSPLQQLHICSNDRTGDGNGKSEILIVSQFVLFDFVIVSICVDIFIIHH